MNEKQCPRCGKTKPLDQFGPNVSHADRRDSYCRTCRKEIERNRRGGIERLFAKFSDEEMIAEMRRRGLME